MERTTVRYSEVFKRQVAGELERGRHPSIERARKAYGVRGSMTVLGSVMTLSDTRKPGKGR